MRTFYREHYQIKHDTRSSFSHANVYIILSFSETHMGKVMFEKRSLWGLTGDSERGGAAVSAMLVGSLAAVFTTVGLHWVQELQRGTAVAADDSILLALSDLNARLVPFEGHTRSILDLTFELGVSANVYLQR